MKKNPFIFRRRKPMSLMEMSFTCIGIKRPKKRGKYLKSAMLILGYGGGLKKAMKLTGLSKRRLKGIKKISSTFFGMGRSYGKSTYSGHEAQLNPLRGMDRSKMFYDEFMITPNYQVFHDGWYTTHHDFSKLEERVTAHIVNEREKHALELMGMGKPLSDIEIMAKMEKSGRTTIQVLKDRVRDNLRDVVNTDYYHYTYPNRDLISKGYHSCA